MAHHHKVQNIFHKIMMHLATIMLMVPTVLGEFGNLGKPYIAVMADRPRRLDLRSLDHKYLLKQKNSMTDHFIKLGAGLVHSESYLVSVVALCSCIVSLIYM